MRHWERVRLRFGKRLTRVLFVGFACCASVSAQVPEIVAFFDDPAPGGGTFAYFSEAAIAPNGKVVFSGFRSNESRAVWAGVPGTLREVAAENQPAPGTMWVFGDFSGPVVNSSGKAAFFADSTGSEFVAGIWAEGAGLVAAVKHGDPVFGRPEAQVAEVGTPAYADSGTVACKARLVGLMDPAFATTAILAGPPGQMAVVIEEGMAVPHAGGALEINSLFAYPEYPEYFAVNAVDRSNNGRLIFKAETIDPVTGEARRAIIIAGWLSGLRALAVEGRPAPGIPSEIVGEVSPKPSISPNGDFVAFRAVLESNLGSEPEPDEAILAGSMAGMLPVARSGDAAPGLPGWSFYEFGEPSVNDHGVVVFTARIREIEGEPEDSLWAVDAEGSFILLTRRGESLPTRSGDSNVLSIAGDGPDGAGKSYAIAIVGFESGSGVYRFSLPEPAPPPKPRPRPVFDTDRPELHFTSPSRQGQRTRGNSVYVAGTASDAFGVDRVEYRVLNTVMNRRERRLRRRGNTESAYKMANGAEKWSFRVPLQMGRNIIRVRAIDRVGNSSGDWTLIVVRY